MTELSVLGVKKGMKMSITEQTLVLENYFFSLKSP